MAFFSVTFFSVKNPLFENCSQRHAGGILAVVFFAMLECAAFWKFSGTINTLVLRA